MPMMTLGLLMVFEISVAMAIGFILGRIWQIRCDLEQQHAGGFMAPPIAHIPRPRSLSRAVARRAAAKLLTCDEALRIALKHREAIPRPARAALAVDIRRRWKPIGIPAI